MTDYKYKSPGLISQIVKTIARQRLKTKFTISQNLRKLSLGTVKVLLDMSIESEKEQKVEEKEMMMKIKEELEEMRKKLENEGEMKTLLLKYDIPICTKAHFYLDSCK